MILLRPRPGRRKDGSASTFSGFVHTFSEETLRFMYVATVFLHFCDWGLLRTATASSLINDKRTADSQTSILRGRKRNSRESSSRDGSMASRRSGGYARPLRDRDEENKSALLGSPRARNRSRGQELLVPSQETSTEEETTRASPGGKGNQTDGDDTAKVCKLSSTGVVTKKMRKPTKKVLRASDDAQERLRHMFGEHSWRSCKCYDRPRSDEAEQRRLNNESSLTSSFSIDGTADCGTSTAVRQACSVCKEWSASSDSTGCGGFALKQENGKCVGRVYPQPRQLLTASSSAAGHTKGSFLEMFQRKSKYLASATTSGNEKAKSNLGAAKRHQQDTTADKEADGIHSSGTCAVNRRGLTAAMSKTFSVLDTKISKEDQERMNDAELSSNAENDVESLGNRIQTAALPNKNAGTGVVYDTVKWVLERSALASSSESAAAIPDLAHSVVNATFQEATNGAIDEPPARLQSAIVLIELEVAVVTSVPTGAYVGRDPADTAMRAAKEVLVRRDVEATEAGWLAKRYVESYFKLGAADELIKANILGALGLPVLTPLPKNALRDAAFARLQRVVKSNVGDEDRGAVVAALTRTILGIVDGASIDEATVTTDAEAIADAAIVWHSDRNDTTLAAVHHAIKTALLAAGFTWPDQMEHNTENTAAADTIADGNSTALPSAASAEARIRAYVRDNEGTHHRDFVRNLRPILQTAGLPQTGSPPRDLFHATTIADAVCGVDSSWVLPKEDINVDGLSAAITAALTEAQTFADTDETSTVVSSFLLKLDAPEHQDRASLEKLEDVVLEVYGGLESTEKETVRVAELYEAVEQKRWCEHGTHEDECTPFVCTFTPRSELTTTEQPVERPDRHNDADAWRWLATVDGDIDLNLRVPYLTNAQIELAGLANGTEIVAQQILYHWYCTTSTSEEVEGEDAGLQSRAHQEGKPDTDEQWTFWVRRQFDTALDCGEVPGSRPATASASSENGTADSLAIPSDESNKGTDPANGTISAALSSSRTALTPDGASGPALFLALCGGFLGMSALVSVIYVCCCMGGGRNAAGNLSDPYSAGGHYSHLDRNFVDLALNRTSEADDFARVSDEEFPTGEYTGPRIISSPKKHQEGSTGASAMLDDTVDKKARKVKKAQSKVTFLEQGYVAITTKASGSTQAKKQRSGKSSEDRALVVEAAMDLLTPRGPSEDYNAADLAQRGRSESAGYDGSTFLNPAVDYDNVGAQSTDGFKGGRMSTGSGLEAVASGLERAAKTPEQVIQEKFATKQIPGPPPAPRIRTDAALQKAPIPR
ncbi:unnamed protein product [Amoebophrya sp. A120]|nr:unnamed protein product [Amoebophrya sp. A120]|eukprot:GSA120T00002702001.1